jgi:hypothetical protein
LLIAVVAVLCIRKYQASSTGLVMFTRA